MSSFLELGLSEQVLRGVQKSGYETPTPIQEKAIPLAVKGGDLTGCAQTGTGKTAAFVLPMLSRLSSSVNNQDNRGNNGRRHRRPVRALVLAPTRELAVQVKEAVEAYGAFTGLRSVAIYGGVGMYPQISALRRGVDIVIATPGRLMDHMGRRNIDLRSVETFVLDEADRMFDMGFINDVKQIVSDMPEKRQTLLFSATMPPVIEKLARQIQTNPELIEVGQRTNAAESVEQKVCGVRSDRKVDLLLHLLKNEPMGSTLVFTRTKHRADKVAKRLNSEDIPSVAIHSNRTQNQRQRGLAAFARGTYQVMVATDIAARGLDVDGITHVINLDCPQQPEDYIHRIGRTGRAQEQGEAWTFISPEEKGGLRGIERTIKKTIPRMEVEGLTIELYDNRQNRPGRSGGADSRSRSGAGGGRRSDSGSSSYGSRSRSRSNRDREESRWNSGGERSRSGSQNRTSSNESSYGSRSRSSREREESRWDSGGTRNGSGAPKRSRSRSGEERSERGYSSEGRSNNRRSQSDRPSGKRSDSPRPRSNSDAAPAPARKEQRTSSGGTPMIGKNRRERRLLAGITRPATDGEDGPRRKRSNGGKGHRKGGPGRRKSTTSERGA